MSCCSATRGPQGLLDAPPPGLGCTLDMPATSEQPGTFVGPYKLLQQLGEGGMGTVYMAEQDRPVRRKVALKVIKAGMDTRQVVARFEAERQALAVMDHVNIARVLDAGATESGRPYFVMELIHGVPITRYCDDNRLTPRERLELFVPICQAIQHAHQKGIIHRDIKPTNVMIALYDGKPVPKVIDFGVAKATEQTLTERTLFTQYGAMVGTLEYMSPEQAEINQLDIDTRSDIYSLGVLLYELLTGSPPFTRKDSKTAGLLETLRMIREQEPPRPSAKLSTAEGLPTLATNRGMEPEKLRKLVRGELDWIVMRCLEKDRNRRYETASSLAADVLRYLHDEPVRACPPSTLYRFRKFARRNRRAVVTASAAALVVVLAVAGLATSTLLIARGNGRRRRPGKPCGTTRTSTGSRWPTANCPWTTWAAPSNSSGSARKTCAAGSGTISCGSAGSSRWSSGTRPKSTALRLARTASSSPPRSGTGPSRCGAAGPARRSRPSPRTPIRFTAWYSTPTAGTWPRRARTGR